MTPSATTVALHSPPGRGGIAVLVLSGPDAEAILGAAFRARSGGADKADNVLSLGHLVEDGRIVDEAVVCRREGAVEISTHGGPAVAAAALALLGRLGAQVLPAPAAAPPSFATAHPRWRNPAVGRELLEALPDARGELVVSTLSHQWAAGLSRLAREALADPSGTQGSLTMAGQLRAAAGRLPAMRRLLQPAEVVLAGPPNVGKSTLANALVGRPISLVHDQPGTTRDWVRELAVLRGVPVYVTDTAGLWDAGDEIDAEAIRRARLWIAAADVVLLLEAGGRLGAPEWLDAKAPRPAILRIAAKIDICPPPPGVDAAICAPTGAGLDRLACRVVEALDLADIDPAAPAAFTARQAALLAQAVDAMDAQDLPSARRALSALLEG